jgi:hypothetical protein
VVIARELIDDAGEVLRVLQLKDGQPQSGGPALGPLDEPADVHGVQIYPEPIEQGAGLVRPKGEVGGPDLAEHTGQAQPVQRPGRVSAGRDHEAETRRRALNQPQQTLVHREPGDLVQVVEHEDDRRPVGGQRRRELPRRLLQVVARNGLTQCASSNVPDHRDERIRDGRPETPHIVVGRAERDPCRRAPVVVSREP